MNSIDQLDDPMRLGSIRSKILSKPSLTMFYRETYGRYLACLARCPADGVVLELGAGASFVKQHIPEVVTSDLLPYEGIDQIVDATKMPFSAGSLRAIFMMNVFHHIPDVAAFLGEATRCLRPGGRLLIVDQYPGWLSTWIYRYLHHEPFDPNALDWRFESSGPLSGANGALAWIVFERDRKTFEALFPELHIERIEPRSPFCYWLTGGLKNWSLLPAWGYRFVTVLDQFLVKVFPQLASFVDIELVRGK